MRLRYLCCSAHADQMDSELWNIETHRLIFRESLIVWHWDDRTALHAHSLGDVCTLSSHRGHLLSFATEA